VPVDEEQEQDLAIVTAPKKQTTKQTNKQTNKNQRQSINIGERKR
jgi:hypothetical protein